MENEADPLDQLRHMREAQDIAKQYQVRPELIRAMMETESDYNPAAVGPRTSSGQVATGLMQLMPATQERFGVTDPTDPSQNIHAGTAFMKELLQKYQGDEGKAVAAYHAGEGNARKAFEPWWASGNTGVPDSHPNTKEYVQRVLARAGQESDPLEELRRMRASVTSVPPATVEKINQASKEPETLDIHSQMQKDKDVAGFGRAFVPSVGGQLKKTYETVKADPIGFVTSPFTMGMGALQGAFMGKDKPITNWTDYRPEVQSFVDAKKNEWGSLDAARHNLLTNPGGAMADAAMVLTPAAKLLRGGGALTGNAALTRAGMYTDAAASAIDPVQLALTLAHHGGQRPLDVVAESLVNSNMGVPKAMRRKERRSDTTIAQDVLNENRGWFSNPFTRTSAGGLHKAENRRTQFEADYNALMARDTAAGNTYPIDRVDRALGNFRDQQWNQANAQPRVNEAEAVRQNFEDNPGFARDITRTVYVGSPGRGGFMGLQPQSTLTPTTQVVGRQFIPQTATELNRVKVNTDRNLQFGERGTTKQEAEKVARREIDAILDENIPGSDELNTRRSQNIKATKALTEAVLSNETKRRIGFAEGMLGGAGFAFGSGHPFIGTAMSVPWAYNTIVKHPWLTSAVTTPMHFAARLEVPRPLRPAVQALSPLTQLQDVTPEFKKNAVGLYEKVYKWLADQTK